MGFSDKFFGNMTAIFSTMYNCFFIFITGEELHLIGGALGLIFTVLLNFRRVLRELNQLYLVIRAKNETEAQKLLKEDLEEKDKA